MKKFTFCLLQIILSFFLYANAYSQDPVQAFTPNAAGLGQYRQVSVSYFNGLPQISIPLTTFKAKGYELPINLTYHASGNKPDSHPGCVGQGWSLRAGGMINRIINRAKDEISAYELFEGMYSRADFVQKNDDWSTNSFLENVYRQQNVYQ